MINFDYDKILGEIPHRLNESLAAHTGFKTGGPADCMAWPQNREQLLQTVQRLRAEQIPFFLLGNGSNVLALDEGYRGCVVKTEKALTELHFEDDGLVYCEAGIQLSVLCKACQKNGLTGLEFAFGIPGTVGGALFMNAGAYDGEMKDVVVSVEVLDIHGNLRTLSAADMQFSYRSSAAQSEQLVILSGRFQLCAGSASEILARMNELMQRRKDKQPLDKPSCGSTFKRPAGSYASKLIDECGLRGFRYGGAQVSEKHCGFVVNAGGAASADILALVEQVKTIVKDKTGYDLECEIRLLQ